MVKDDLNRISYNQEDYKVLTKEATEVNVYLSLNNC
jgi:hypothetical protein